MDRQGSAVTIDMVFHKEPSIEDFSRLADLAAFLQTAPWERSDLDQWLRDYCEVKGIKLGMVAQPLRAARLGRWICWENKCFPRSYR